MSVSHHSPTRHPHPAGRLTLAVVTAAVLLAAALLAGAGVARAHTVVRAIADPMILRETATQQDRHFKEMASSLRARYVRLGIYWYQCEPAQGVYDEAYLQWLADSVGRARAAGLKVMITFGGVPRWASDDALWNDPPGGYAKGYQPFYLPKPIAGIAALKDFAEHLSGLPGLKGQVFAYEAWNEPNLFMWLYPQRLDGQYVGVKCYFEMLKAVHDGVALGDPDAKIVAGGTAPFGLDDKTRTAPQTFARELEKEGAAAYFDAYSHHPYIVGGSRNLAPSSPPDWPEYSVTLSNLRVLLNLFRDKPFYLTEYGYNTAYCTAFSGLTVSESQQAAYLRSAYSYAARYPQVKMIMWYQRKDWSPTGVRSDKNGFYTGLRGLDDHRKRAWYAFAGGIHLTVSAPASVHRGSSALLRGRLSGVTVGGISGKRLELQRRTSAGWRLVRTLTSGSGGYYHVSVRPTLTTKYRLLWKGVVASPSRTIRVY